jgi:hypothetical protein
LLCSCRSMRHIFVARLLEFGSLVARARHEHRSHSFDSGETSGRLSHSDSHSSGRHHFRQKCTLFDFCLFYLLIKHRIDIGCDEDTKCKGVGNCVVFEHVVQRESAQVQSDHRVVELGIDERHERNSAIVARTRDTYSIVCLIEIHLITWYTFCCYVVA